MDEKNLDLLRTKIDLIDNQLMELIVKRSSIVDDIGKLKKDFSEVVDKKREKEVINRLLSLHEGNFSKDSIVRIWKEIFHTSVNIQLRKKEILKSKRGIDLINLYKGGTSKISGINKVIKLSSNESPFEPSQKSIEGYKQNYKKLSRYPELTAESLQLLIAKKHNLNPDQVISGNGSNEILIFTVLAFCSPGDEIIHAQHGFEMYPIMAKYAGAESIKASEDDYKISIKSVINKISDSTKIIFIANPSNPTGTYLNKVELRSFINQVPKHIIVVIDAAYAEFADAKDYDKTFSLVNEYENVLITRTFSKAYSLAGIRLGWGYASKNLINIIKKLRPPFNLSSGSIAAGIGALNDDNYLNKVVDYNSKIKHWFINELNILGFKAYPTQANFVFVIIPEKDNFNAGIINEVLLSKGIAVRHLLSYGLNNSLRITLGTKEELNQTLNVLKNYIKNHE